VGELQFAKACQGMRRWPADAMAKEFDVSGRVLQLCEAHEEKQTQ